MSFNFVIGYLEGGRIVTYAYGSEVQYGNQKQADRMLEYVKSQHADQPWQIFKVLPYSTASQKIAAQVHAGEYYDYHK